MSKYYAIQNLDEAVAFLKDSYLGSNMREICLALLQLNTSNATEVFGRPDDMKLKSSMTLFMCACEDPLIFQNVLDKFFDGKVDNRTIHLLDLY